MEKLLRGPSLVFRAGEGVQDIAPLPFRQGTEGGPPSVSRDRFPVQTARHAGWDAPVFVMTICQSWMLLDRKAPAQDSR